MTKLTERQREALGKKICWHAFVDDCMRGMLLIGIGIVLGKLLFKC